MLRCPDFVNQKSQTRREKAISTGKLPVLHLQHPIRDMKPAIVMGDGGYPAH
jgi:hypothetical protein